MYEDISKLIRETRESLGWSKASLAKKAGVSTATISKYEKGFGEHVPTANPLFCIITALGLTFVIRDRKTNEMHDIEWPGEGLKHARVSRGLSLSQLGNKAGINRGNLSVYERGLISPKINTLTSLLSSMNYSLGIRRKNHG